MGNFLTALANIGSQYAEGRVAGQEEKEQLAQEKSRTALDEQQQAYQQKYLDYQMQQLANQAKTGQILNTKYGPYDVTHGRWITPPRLDADGAGMAALKKLMQDAKASPELQAQVQDVYEGAVEDDPYNLPKARSAAVSYFKSEQDKITADKNRREEKAAALKDSLDSKLQFLRMSIMMRPSAQEWQRADLAKNVNENLNTIEAIVNKRPDLFGPGWGRLTQLRAWIGTNDPDIAALKQAEDNLGRALTGAHGMRAASTLETAGNGVLNNFKNGPEATLNAIATARGSVNTFIEDVQEKLELGTAGAPAPKSKLDQILDNKFGPQQAGGPQ